MTKAELVQIIKDNFTNEHGHVDITGLEFDCNVNISRMKVEGTLFQDSQQVGRDLFQSHQKVRRTLFQSKQEVGGDLYQYSQKAKRRIFS